MADMECGLEKKKKKLLQREKENFVEDHNQLDGCNHLIIFWLFLWSACPRDPKWY